MVYYANVISDFSMCMFCYKCTKFGLGEFERFYLYGNFVSWNSCLGYVINKRIVGDYGRATVLWFAVAELVLRSPYSLMISRDGC